MPNFDVEWNQAVLRANKNIEAIIREASSIMLKDIIYDTPVDTGALKGNWVTSINNPKDVDTGILDKDGARTAAKARQVCYRFKMGNSIHMVNNKPYAEVIEYGRSQQAPVGMVRVNIVRFSTIVDQVARQFKDKV